MSAMLNETVGEHGICFICARNFKMTRMFDATMTSEGMNMQAMVSNMLNPLKNGKFLGINF